MSLCIQTRWTWRQFALVRISKDFLKPGRTLIQRKEKYERLWKKTVNMSDKNKWVLLFVCNLPSRDRLCFHEWLRTAPPPWICPASLLKSKGVTLSFRTEHQIWSESVRLASGFRDGGYYLLKTLNWAFAYVWQLTDIPKVQHHRGFLNSNRF